MSIILDALRRKTERGTGSHGQSRSPRPESLLAALGSSPTSNRRPRSRRAILVGGAIALAVGFAAVAVPVFWLAPESPQGATPVAQASRPPVVNPPRRVGPAPPAEADPIELARASSRQAMVATVPDATGPADPRSERRSPAPGPSESRPASPGPQVSVAVPAPPQPGPGEASLGDRFGLALYYQRIGDLTRSIAEYQNLLDHNDASAEVHNNLGLLYEARGEPESALARFRRAIELDPRHVSAHNNLGVAYLRAGDLEAAAAQFAVALDIEPRNVESLVNLGLAHQAAGRLEEARATLLRALAVDPRRAGSHYNFAVLSDGSGDVRAAVTHYRAFLRYGTVEYPDLAARVRTRLSVLGS